MGGLLVWLTCCTAYLLYLNELFLRGQAPAFLQHWFAELQFETERIWSYFLQALPLPSLLCLGVISALLLKETLLRKSRDERITS